MVAYGLGIDRHWDGRWFAADGLNLDALDRVLPTGSKFVRST